MTTKADSSTPQEIETRLDAFYAAWQVRDGVGMRALFGGDLLLVWACWSGSGYWASSTGRWTGVHPGCHLR
jgi:hypothetical protein